MSESAKIIIENNLNNIKEKFTKIIEENINTAKVLEITSNSVTLSLPNMKKASESRKKEHILSQLINYDLPGISWYFYDSELAWAVPKIRSLLENVIQPACPHDLIKGVDISTRGDVLNISIYSWDMDMPEREKKVRKCVDEAMPSCREIYPTGRFNILYSNGHPTFPSHFMADSTSHHLEDDFDEGVNPNWPSRTGNPSGKGRGNNPSVPKR